MSNEKGVACACEIGILQSYLDGKLSVTEKEVLWEHLANCEGCRDNLGGLRKIEPILKKSMSSLRECSAPDLSATDILNYDKKNLKKRYFSKEVVSHEAPFRAFFEIFLGAASRRWAFAGASCFLILFSVLFGMEQDFFDSSKQVDLIAKGTQVRMLYSLVSGEHLNQFKATHEMKGNVSLRARDLIQFSYQFQHRTHLMIVGLNEQGKVFRLIPFEAEGKSLSVKSSRGTFPKGEAFQLDEYLGAERYFVILSDHSFHFTKLKRILLAAWRKSGRNLNEMKDVKFSRWKVKSWLVHKKVRLGEKSNIERGKRIQD